MTADNCIILLAQLWLFWPRTQSDKIECMLTSNLQPEPKLQKVTKASMSSQANSIVASISVHASAVESLW